MLSCLTWSMGWSGATTGGDGRRHAKGKSARRKLVKEKGVVYIPQFQEVMNKVIGSGIIPCYCNVDEVHENASDNGETISWLLATPGLDPACGRLGRGRARRKQQQVANMLAAAEAMLEKRKITITASHGGAVRSTTKTSSACHRNPRCLTKGLHVVEFAAGTGHVALPLAAKYPDIKVTVIDADSEATRVSRQRVRTAGVKNVRCINGDVRDFDETFDLGIALHACGEATDASMEKCLAARAAFVFGPCCIGKVQGSSLQYPRSASFRSVLQSRKEYEYLASAADSNEAEQCLHGHQRHDGDSDGDEEAIAGMYDVDDRVVGERQRLRRVCKSLIETDRRMMAEEAGYCAWLTRMVPARCTPKNDIIVGHPAEWCR